MNPINNRNPRNTRNIRLSAILVLTAVLAGGFSHAAEVSIENYFKSIYECNTAVYKLMHYVATNTLDKPSPDDLKGLVSETEKLNSALKEKIDAMVFNPPLDKRYTSTHKVYVKHFKELYRWAVSLEDILSSGNRDELSKKIIAGKSKLRKLRAYNLSVLDAMKKNEQ